MAPYATAHGQYFDQKKPDTVQEEEARITPQTQSQESTSLHRQDTPTINTSYSKSLILEPAKTLKPLSINSNQKPNQLKAEPINIRPMITRLNMGSLSPRFI